MREAGSGVVFSRRGLLTLVATAGGAAWNRALAAASEFWNKKPPADWTSEEIDRLVTASPWARQVNAQVLPPERGESRQGGPAGYPDDGTGYPGGSRSPRGGGGMGGPSIGIPGIGMPRIGGMGGPRIGGGGMGGGRGGGGQGRGGGRSPGRSQVKGTVRWESAKPILEALKSPLPEAFADHYVVSVSGFPLSGGGRRAEVGSEERGAETPDDALERLKSFTYLEPTGKRSAQPGVVQRQAGAGDGTILFGFSKEFLNLGPRDKEVVFTTNLGRASIKTKFDLKAMRYQGTLAV
jgi:hypothetical protein